MAEALYRKYRSKKFSDVVGQEHITQTLERSIKNGKLSHAYLFSGPRGVGKTSVARILAHRINNFEYLDDGTNYLDIIELDAASNRGIEDMKQLIDRVWLAPSDGSHKVFIIDEVHMLTGPAFNALLKTLEEPPEYVVFIFATTEAHKLPETIISRTQQFTFRPITKKNVVTHLSLIAKTEKINIEPAAIEFIADYGEGSFRDSIGLLDQASNIKGQISLQDIEFIVGAAPREVVEMINKAQENGSMKEIRKVFEVISSNGYSIESIVKQLIKSQKEKLNDKDTSDENIRRIKLIYDLLTVNRSSDPLTALEVVLYTNILNADNVEKIQKKPAQMTISDTAQTKKLGIDKATSTKEKKEESQNRTVDIPDQDFNEIWAKTLNDLKSKYSTLYSIAKLSEMTFDDSQVTLRTKFSFHQKSLSESKNKTILNNIIYEISGKTYKIDVVIDKTVNNHIEAEISEHPLDLDITSISNIFGGAEVVE
jgi:DNA polymerase-3 subunit gamma/tau